MVQEKLQYVASCKLHVTGYHPINHNLQPAPCNLHPASCTPQPATCNSQPATIKNNIKFFPLHKIFYKKLALFERSSTFVTH